MRNEIRETLYLVSLFGAIVVFFILVPWGIA